jgi:hypothetical protein
VPRGPIQTKTGRIWLAGGIIHVAYVADAELGVDDAIQDLAAMPELAGGTRRPAYVDISRVRSTSGAARATYAGAEAATVSSALALLVRSPISRVLGNFYLGPNRPTFPAKLFTEPARALQWLQSFIAVPHSEPNPAD